MKRLRFIKVKGLFEGMLMGGRVEKLGVLVFSVERILLDFLIDYRGCFFLCYYISYKRLWIYTYGLFIYILGVFIGKGMYICFFLLIVVCIVGGCLE